MELYSRRLYYTFCRGMYDEKCQSNGYAPGYYAHASKLKNISNEQFKAETMHIQSTENDYYELTADEFSV